MIRKIELQNAAALVQQKFEPILQMIADYEAGKDPDDWRQDKMLVKFFGYGTTLEAVILHITQNYEVKPKRAKPKTEKLDNG